jgi:hypothetical protein
MSGHAQLHAVVAILACEAGGATSFVTDAGPRKIGGRTGEQFGGKVSQS